MARRKGCGSFGLVTLVKSPLRKVLVFLLATPPMPLFGTFAHCVIFEAQESYERFPI